MPSSQTSSANKKAHGPRSVGLACILALLVCGNARAAHAADDQQVDRAITRALKYLASQQQPSGAWIADTFGESTAITSLAVMAFLSAGHVPGEGPYGKQIERGILWVLEHQQPNGMLVHRTGHGPMYCHGISTLMLAEVVGMVDKNQSAQVRKALERAVLLILQSQQVQKNGRHAGGWRYQPTSNDSDLSVTGWQLLALRAAKDVGCDVPAESIDAAVAYVRNCSTRDRGGFGYQPGGGPTAVLTGTGITALEVCGEHRSEEVLGGAEWMLVRPLRPEDSFYFYGVYYCSVGMFKVGEQSWDDTKALITEQLLARQADDGSWNPTNHQERQAGKDYATSMAVLGLAVEYQYLPIYQR